MIQSFKSKAAEDIYHGWSSREALKIPSSLWKASGRKMDMLNAARLITDLKVPPGNRLEALKGNLKGKWSIRINDQFRLVFVFKDGNTCDVEIAD